MLHRYSDDAGRRWYVTPDGLHVPSVTTVLRPRAYRNAAMDAGARRGSRLHSCIDAYAAGRPVSPEMDAVPYWDSLRPWLESQVTAWHEQELTVWCDLYAGRLDSIVTVRDVGRVLLDWKTSSKSVRRVGSLTRWGPQLGAYARLYLEPLDAAGVVVAYDGEPADVWIYTLDEVEAITQERFDSKLGEFYEQLSRGTGNSEGPGEGGFAGW